MHQVVVEERVKRFLDTLPAKSRRICIENLKKLTKPYPGRGPGDKERLMIGGKERYRFHIGRTYTAFYIIDESNKLVRVVELLGIKAAHKRYGF